MTSNQELIFDNWAPLSYKTSFVSGWGPWKAPLWTGQHHRRLHAYKLLHAYRENISRHYLETQDVNKRRQRREMGDANHIVETIVDAILGEDVQIHVQDAGDPDAPNAVSDALQTWFDEWAEKERPLLSIIEAEEDAVCLGDGVWAVSWDSATGRPVVTAYDPGFYFPYIDPLTDGRAFPNTVHMAWEYQQQTNDNGWKTFIRRITWRLVDTGVASTLPWNSAPSAVTCLLTDASWELEGAKRVDDLSLGRAVYAVNPDGQVVQDLDLGIDFIPVVHLPNTIARKEHFGKSSLMRVLQLLDELQSADTDLALSARTTGFPPIATKGPLQTSDDGKTIISYGPGTVLQGEVTVIDTSTSLDALLKYVEHISRRISTNTRLPESILGQTTGSSESSGAAGYASGFDRQLSFAPIKSMIGKMRLTRDEKYPLLFKFVARFAMQAGLISPNPDLPPVKLQFGPFLPSDRTAEVAEIIALYAAKLLSQLTAIRLLIALGLEIEDAEGEIAAIDAAAQQAMQNQIALAQATQPPPAAPGTPQPPGGKK